ncbi:Chitin synthase, class 5 [Orbilia oligospora]|uniref:Chitin synthase, class 5 n=1 Tax=Orbilia oligospora TaxID=2813651 RepID=A0A6G1LVZ5_ORBOL|nr:Chitin synthase, class 5 [Orbilia oligospora]KAF3236444.1 Chitin synthase, class 5 [Orbilia oligospora]
MLVSLTVGKVDAGLAILLTKDKRLIEFPSVLLPPGVSSGSIIDIQVSRNNRAEGAARQAFETLQNEIYSLFGQRSPSKPVLRIRNATQTSVVLEWDPIDLATASLRSLSLYRNNSKAGNIPNPTTHHSTKISGLAVDTEYSFHLVLRTSAGTYASEKVTTRTHKMTDLSGITICPGVMSPSEKERLKIVIERIGAKPLQDHVRIDTTHFVCTEGRGHGWERAQEMNIPIVRPEWLEACEHEGRIVGVRTYYLGADSALRTQRARPVSHALPQSGAGQGPPGDRRDSVTDTNTSKPAHQVTNPTGSPPEVEGATTAVEKEPSPPLDSEQLPMEDGRSDAPHVTPPGTACEAIAADRDGNSGHHPQDDADFTSVPL